MDLLIALVPMFAWGSIGLVSSKIGGSANQQTLGMTLGALVYSILAFLVLQPTMDMRVLMVGFVSGMFWSVGQNGQFNGMKSLGVSVGIPLSTGMQLILTTLIGAIFFKEWTTTGHFVYGALALAVLILGVYLTAKQDESETNVDAPKLDFAKGFRALIISTFGYAAYTVIVRIFDVDATAVILPQSIGMVVGASLFAFRKVKLDGYVWKNMASGLLWGLGNMCMFITVSNPKFGLALGFSLSQLGIVISTFGGIYLLGEKKTKKEMVYVVVGCALVLLGALLLGWMK